MKFVDICIGFVLYITRAKFSKSSRTCPPQRNMLVWGQTLGRKLYSCNNREIITAEMSPIAQK